MLRIRHGISRGYDRHTPFAPAAGHLARRPAQPGGDGPDHPV